jgi:hypothetical protein
MSRLASIAVLIAGAALLTGCAGPPPVTGPIEWQVDLGDGGNGTECSDSFVERRREEAAAEGSTLERMGDLDFFDFDDRVAAAVGTPWCALEVVGQASMQAIYLEADGEGFLGALRDSGLSVDETEPNTFSVSHPDSTGAGTVYLAPDAADLDTESILVTWAGLRA